MKQIMTLFTVRGSIRDEIDGWGSAEDPRLMRADKPIGLSPSCRAPYYDCVLRAMHDGWELLAPATKTSSGWEWTMVRDCAHPSADRDYARALDTETRMGRNDLRYIPAGSAG